ncbi:MAG: LysM peptidoglycan-binding domain-containing protein [Anaerolineae bacterium]|nr:LysM peptidoglycan-binding domain-containing protein [Anaerolineae bacterium]
MRRSTAYTPRSKVSYIVLGLMMGIGLGLLLTTAIFLLARLTAPAPAPPPSPFPSPSLPPTDGAPFSTPPIPSPSPLPTVPSPLTYTVREGDTLWDIAARFDTTVQALQAANGLSGDLIYPGQVLVIPSSSAPIPTPSPLSAPLTPVVAVWRPSILEGNLEAAYPVTFPAGRFTLHYAPDTEAARHAQEAAGRVAQALEHIEHLLGVRLEGPFDVYLAGTLFAPPDLALRGRSFSARRQLFVLYDGTGNPADQQYIITHELTHLVAWNTLGRPSSALLSEGLAVYAGMTHIADSAHLPPEAFCTAYQRAGKLPRISAVLRFEGHIYDLPNYYAAGCFVRYLVETYGMENLKAVYPSSDYRGLYGYSLADLEREWTARLEANPFPLPFPPDDLVRATAAVDQAYEDLFSRFTGTPAEFARYRRVDAARLALLEGRLQDVWACLDPSAPCIFP